MIKSFLSLVEIKTKVASVIPFLLGTFYTVHRFDTFNIKNFILLFISLITFDMTTTAINNYYDYKKAHKTKGYGYEIHNAIVRYGLNEKKVISIIYFLLITAIIFGVLLYFHTSIVVLAIGVLSFLVGILYSFGPIPISRMPLGELFSGFFMGFVIIFLSVYIHVIDENILLLFFENKIISIHLNILEILYIFLFSLPATIGIANIMLANNICDIDDDIDNKRYTLPVYIGKEKSLLAFKILYYIIYIDLIILLILRVIPLISLLTLFTFFVAKKNIDLFFKKQSKKETFIVSIKNFVLTNIIYLLSLVASVVINYFR